MCHMSKTIHDWVSEGEAIYTAAVREFESLQGQIEELETRLNAKREEVNQVAEMLGKPLMEGSRKVSAQIVENPTPPPAMGAIARALSGRGMTARQS